MIWVRVRVNVRVMVNELLGLGLRKGNGFCDGI